MLTTIDLTPRHAARILEQAVRSRARLDIEPSAWSDGRTLKGTLWRREGNLLTVDLDQRHGADGGDDATMLHLIGAFCDIRTMLQNHAFVFSTCVLDVIEETSPAKLVIAVPESMQLTNRRRFERTNATVASQVRLWSDEESPATVGLLVNIGPEGLAAQFVGPGLADSVMIGDTVRVSFEIAGFEESYKLPSVVCTKALSSDKTILSVGVQFDRDSGDPRVDQSLRQLAAILSELMIDPNSTEEMQ